MNAIVPLHFDSFDVRMIMLDGEPWWVGTDVAVSLDLANPRQVLSRLEDYEKGVHIVDTLGGPQSVTIINESGFYSLLLTSRKPVAKAVKRWLTVEVLPAIRKFGMYPPPPIAELVDQSRWAGVGQTIAARFQEERLLWEERTGRTFAGSVPGFTKQLVEAIERGAGKILTKDRLHMLILAELDVLYILTGRRRFSLSEHRLIDQVRARLPAPE